jgi:hypothetical protein
MLTNPTTFFFPHVGPYMCEICCVVIKTNNAFLNHITKLHKNVADPKVLEIMDKRIRNRAPLRGRPPKCAITHVEERELTPHPKKGLKSKAVDKESDDGGSSQVGNSNSVSDGPFQVGNSYIMETKDKRIHNRAPLKGKTPKCTITKVKERELTPHPKKSKSVDRESDDGGSSEAGYSDSDGDGSFQAGDNHKKSDKGKIDQVQISGEVEIVTRGVAENDGRPETNERPMPECGSEDEFPQIDIKDDELLDGVVPDEEKEYTASQVIAKIEKLGLVSVSLVPKPEFVELSTDDDESEDQEVKA